MLGNLDAKRDWGHAKDYVEMQWLMLQQEKAEDYCIATGKQHTVREFIEKACSVLEIDLAWKGKGEEEVGIDASNDKIIIKIDKKYYRPTEVESLLGDSSKAARQLNWKPKITFDELVKEMIMSDYNKI